MTELERAVVHLRRDAYISYTYLLRVLDELIALPLEEARNAALEALKGSVRLIAHLDLLINPDDPQTALLEETRLRLLAAVKEATDGGE